MNSIHNNFYHLKQPIINYQLPKYDPKRKKRNIET